MAPQPPSHAVRSVAAALAALALAGCGGISSDRDEARSAVQRFNAALAHDDGARACGQLSSDLVEQLEQDEQQRCPDAVTGLGLQPARVIRVEVFVTNAKVDLQGGQSAFLDREPGGWQLSAIGCKPHGKPADQPLHCEAQT
jgi:hypothetical protein